MKSVRWLASLFWLVAVTAASGTGPSNGTAPEHAVIVHFRYGSKDLQPLFKLEEQLRTVIAKAGVGEYDGNEVAVDGSNGYLYMYGPDADRLFETVKPILESASFMRGAKVKKRYGPPKDGVRQSNITLAP